MINEEAKTIKQANGKRKQNKGKGKDQLAESHLNYESLNKSKYLRKTNGKINNFDINIREKKDTPTKVLSESQRKDLRKQKGIILVLFLKENNRSIYYKYSEIEIIKIQ